MKRILAVVFIVAVSIFISSCVTAQKPSVGVPTIRVLEPLDKPAFKSVKVIGITEMVKGEDGKKEVDLAELKPGFESVLNQVPFFSGGEWPDLNINVKVLSCNSGIGGCWALLIPYILIWPGYMLAGGPIICQWEEVVVIFEAQTGEFKREYKYNVTDYGASGLYYSYDPFDGASMYLGHAFYAFAQKISEDYSDFLKNEIDSNPGMYSKSLDPDVDEWYEGNQNDKIIPAPIGTLTDTKKSLQELIEINRLSTSKKTEDKVAAMKKLGDYASNRLLFNPQDSLALGTIKNLERTSKDQKQPEEVRAAAEECMEKIKTVLDCVLKSPDRNKCK